MSSSRQLTGFLRNFWVSTEVEGEGRPSATGPRTEDGGFTTNIFANVEGFSTRVLTIQGVRQGDSLVIIVSSPDKGLIATLPLGSVNPKKEGEDGKS